LVQALLQQGLGTVTQGTNILALLRREASYTPKDIGQSASTTQVGNTPTVQVFQGVQTVKLLQGFIPELFDMS
jgi:hypothetical protein